MRSQLVRRADLAMMLMLWLDGCITADQVHAWAEERAANSRFDVDDWEGPDSNSVANEILMALDMLDMDLMTPDDIPYYLEFLDTPEGHFEEGHRRWREALHHIDYGARRKALRDVPLYAPFCK